MAEKFSLRRWTNHILNAPYLPSVCSQALQMSLNCMVLGEMEAANRIIDYLYDNDLLAYKGWSRDNTRGKIMHTAWTESDCWPKIYAQPAERSLPPSEHRTVDGPTLFPKADHNGAREKWFALLEKPGETEFVFDDFAAARQMIASGTDYDAKREAIPMSVEIALELGLDDVAGEVAREHLLKLLDKHSDDGASVGVVKSPRLWTLLNAGWLRKDIGLTRAQVEQDAHKFLRLLDERLTKGPAAALKQKSVEELCRLYDRICLKKRRLGDNGATRSFSPDGELDLPTSFLKAPASEAAIEDLEQRVREHGFSDGLPEDYKTFLRTTNGIYFGDDGRNNGEIFCPAADVEFRDFWLQDELVPRNAFPRSTSPWEWPESDEDCVFLGAAGDEGDQMILPPSRVRAAVECFDALYEESSAEERVRLERVVKDLYGGLEQMRAMQSVILRTFHWSPEVEVFDSFKTLLAMSVAGMLTYRGDDGESDVEEGEEEEEEEEDAKGEDGKDAQDKPEDTVADRVKKRHSIGEGDSSKRQKSAAREE